MNSLPNNAMLAVCAWLNQEVGVEPIALYFSRDDGRWVVHVQVRPDNFDMYLSRAVYSSPTQSVDAGGNVHRALVVRGRITLIELRSVTLTTDPVDGWDCTIEDDGGVCKVQR